MTIKAGAADPGAADPGARPPKLLTSSDSRQRDARLSGAEKEGRPDTNLPPIASAESRLTPLRALVEAAPEEKAP